MTDVIHAVDCHSPTRGCHLIVTDDMDTAVVQARTRPNSKTKVLMVDISGKTKTRTSKKVLIIPYGGSHLTDEISQIIWNWR